MPLHHSKQPLIAPHGLKELNIEHIHILWVDIVNHVKSHHVSREDFEKLVATSRPGISVDKASVFQTIAPGIGSTGEYLYAFDLSTLRECLHEPGHATVLGWLEEQHPPPNLEGHRAVPVDLCPRTILRRAVEDAKAQGVSFLVGFDHEFILLKNTSPIQSLTQATQDRWGPDPSDALRKRVYRDIRRYVQASGLVEMNYSETRRGHYEVIMDPLPPLEAVDALVRTREMIHNIASRHDLRATFVQSVCVDTCCAADVHISIQSEDKTKPSSTHSNLSLVESTFLAGLLQHLPDIALLALPTTASFRPVVDGSWFGATYVSWGIDNREVPVRLRNASSPSSRNFKIKCHDATANPYLAVAAFISAGMDGVSNGNECQILPCGPAIDASVWYMDKYDRKKRGITQKMPLTWKDARAAFSESELVDKVFGNNFKTKYLSVNQTLMEQMTLGKTEEEQMEKWVETY